MRLQELFTEGRFKDKDTARLDQKYLDKFRAANRQPQQPPPPVRPQPAPRQPRINPDHPYGVYRNGEIWRTFPDHLSADRAADGFRRRAPRLNIEVVRIKR